MNQKTQQKILDRMLSDSAVRRAVVRRSHQWFFYHYFGQYVEYAAAPFHRVFFSVTEDRRIRTILLSAFRSSAKSTIFSMSFPLWAVMGGHAVKHILIVSSTVEKAERLLGHIRHELETNTLLKGDLGPFKEERSRWNTTSLRITRYDACITAVSREQSVRGIRHNQYRPQLIIVDDLEDLDSVKTQESRDKIDRWITSDLIPSGDRHTRFIFLGTPLHMDSAFMRFRDRIDRKYIKGIHLEYPLYDENRNPTWPGKFPNWDAIEDEKSRGITEAEFLREYQLQIVPDDNQVLKYEDLQFYDVLPNTIGNFLGIETAIDIAVSERSDADYTAMVSGRLYEENGRKVLYILPNPVNERLDPGASVERAIALSRILGNGSPTKMYVEMDGTQRFMQNFLEREGIPAEGMFARNIGDKHARLVGAAAYIKLGNVRFPRHGVDALLNQMVTPGLEKHDDLADACGMLILATLGTTGPYDGWFRRIREETEQFKKLGPAAFTRPRGLVDWVQAAKRGGF